MNLNNHGHGLPPSCLEAGSRRDRSSCWPGPDAYIEWLWLDSLHVYGTDPKRNDSSEISDSHGDTTAHCAGGRYI